MVVATSLKFHLIDDDLTSYDLLANLMDDLGFDNFIEGRFFYLCW